jgi:hypothetical protein
LVGAAALPQRDVSLAKARRRRCAFLVKARKGAGDPHQFNVRKRRLIVIDSLGSAPIQALLDDPTLRVRLARSDAKQVAIDCQVVLSDRDGSKPLLSSSCR